MTEHPGEQFPPAVDPEVEPGYEPDTEEPSTPDYDVEPGPADHMFAADLAEETPPQADPWSSRAADESIHSPTGGDADPGSVLGGGEELGEPTEVTPPVAGVGEVAGGAGESAEMVSSGAVGEPGGTRAGDAVEGAGESAGVGSAGAGVWGAGAGAARPVPGPPVPGPAVGRPSVGGTHGGGVSAPGASSGSSVGAESVSGVGDDGVVAPDGEQEGSHPLVEETMARLGELRERPVSEHGEVYADLHERLQTALVEADADERG